MPHVSSYEPGVPNWVDLATPDINASKAFYGELFGWKANVSPDPQYGGYTMFTLGDTEGNEVAAAMPIMMEGQPPAWTTYINVLDVDATAKAVQAAGGQLFMEPMDVPEQGRMAVFADTTGAALAAWQPYGFKGASTVNEPGSWCWSELNGRDVDAAKAFYGEVFGWDSSTAAFGTTSYTEFKVGGRSIAGMMQMDDNWPPDVPAHWMVYFAVADADATATKTGQLGGTVTVPPTDIPIGRFAVLGDPQGAHFSVIKLNATM
ncbi:VOC family protein [Nocardia sp. SYP-A9097]|uniref:VOC family protein n=1 Tax=Nocardia sp. SYP-A9097 TaxID=2663237 RepID=UPI00129A5FBA|nr:VOC family protein [Nocardia sp. SYP-A9097]MRH87346.1 VOC family protein [Nocardia sp. SYP-A9097]